ncbi:MAG TPA: PEP-CTERM sorting domain-containing protein [Phycisphaerae bacterium]|nr:PEP-CTERM sorting domain-containing protein [Phycisphaerae bacterium]
MRYLIWSLAVVVLAAGSAAASTITFSVATDKSAYLVGETVSWTISIAASNPVTLAGCNLTDSGGHALTVANQYEWLSPGSGAWQLGPDPYVFGCANGLFGLSRGTPSGSTLTDIYEADVSSPFSGGDGNGSPYRFADGGFLAANVGNFDLTVTPMSGNYSGDGTNAAVFDILTGGAAGYEVTPEPTTLVLLAVGLAAVVKRRRAARPSRA